MNKILTWIKHNNLYILSVAIVLLIVLTIASGCDSLSNSIDGNNVGGMAANDANAVGGVLDAVAVASGLASAIVPGLVGVAGIAAGIAGAWKKLTPKIVKAQSNLKKVVESVQTFKETITTNQDATESATTTVDDVLETLSSVCDIIQDDDTKEAVAEIKENLSITKATAESELGTMTVTPTETDTKAV